MTNPARQTVSVPHGQPVTTPDGMPRRRVFTVAHVISGDLWAGAEVQLYNLACAFADDPDIRVMVIVFNEGLLAQRLRERGVSVFVLDESRMSPARILHKTLLLFQRHRPDVVHTHRQKENVIGSLAARLVGAKSIRTVHGNEEYPAGRWQLLRRTQQYIDALCERHLQVRTVAVSSELGDTLQSRHPSVRIEVIENGINIDQLREAGEIRVALPGRPGVVRVAIVSRLVPVKRLDIFLSAAEILVREFGHLFHFYVFGEGPQRDGIATQIADRGLTDHVSLMGFVENMAPYMKRVHMLFITSDHEGMPMNLLEALALEVPVVAHEVGGIARALGHGRYGTLVTSQDPEAYAQAARVYLRDCSQFLQRARQGYSHVRLRYSDAVNARAYKRIYSAISGENLCEA